MSLTIASLNSGSNGNAYYVGNQEEAILVDAGISCREIEKRMLQLGLNIRKLKAILVSHEHTDHTRGITRLANKYELAVYMTPATAQNNGPYLVKRLSIPFESDCSFLVGQLQVTPFRKFHDAADPHSFIIEHQGTVVGVFTDIGKVCDKLTQYFKRCHAAFLEANYDTHLLETGRYPYHLKERIRGGEGHLSNDEAYSLFRDHQPPHMTHILLSHLSRDNNDSEKALALFQSHPHPVNVQVASRYGVSNLIHVNQPSQVAQQIQLF